MDWLTSVVLVFSSAAVTFTILRLREARQRRRKMAPVSFRRMDPRRSVEPTEARNLTAEAAQERRSATRQSTAKFYPRTRNYTTKRKS